PRSGDYSKVLFGEPQFIAAIDRSRWQAYPLGLAMVAEMVEGVLRPHAGSDGRLQFDALRELVLAIFDHYPVPTPLGEAAWSEARGELDRRLVQIGLHPPKRVIDIPERLAKSYFDLMPIHKTLSGSGFPSI